MPEKTEFSITCYPTEGENATIHSIGTTCDPMVSLEDTCELSLINFTILRKNHDHMSQDVDIDRLLFCANCKVPYIT